MTTNTQLRAFTNVAGLLDGALSVGPHTALSSS